MSIEVFAFLIPAFIIGVLALVSVYTRKGPAPGCIDTYHVRKFQILVEGFDPKYRDEPDGGRAIIDKKLAELEVEYPWRC